MFNNVGQKSCVLFVIRNCTPTTTTIAAASANCCLTRRPITICSVRKSIEMVSDRMTDMRYSSSDECCDEMLALSTGRNGTTDSDLLKCQADDDFQLRPNRLSNHLASDGVTRSTTLSDELNSNDFGNDLATDTVLEATSSTTVTKPQNYNPKYCCTLEVKFVWYERCTHVLSS